MLFSKALSLPKKLSFIIIPDNNLSLFDSLINTAYRHLASILHRLHESNHINLGTLCPLIHLIVMELYILKR